MDIDTPVGRQIQDLLPQDLPKRRNHNEVGSPGSQPLHGFRLAQLLRLDQRNSQLLREDLDRGRLELSPAPREAIGLGNNTNYTMVLRQSPESCQRKFRGPHEDNSRAVGKERVRHEVILPAPAD